MQRNCPLDGETGKELKLLGGMLPGNYKGGQKFVVM